MIDTETFDLLYTHLEKRTINSVRDNLNSDANYQYAMTKKCDFYQKYENLNLPKEQCLFIEEWTDAITSRNATYSAIVFRMGMQCCFSNVKKIC